MRVPNTGIIVSAQSRDEGIVKNILPKIKGVTAPGDYKIKNNQQGQPSALHWRTGSVTHLMSAEQDNEAFEGITLDYFWLDEPMRREIYVALKRGLMQSDGHWWWTATLLDEPWIFEDIYIPAREGKLESVAVFEGDTDENVHLSEEAKQEFFSILTPEEIEIRKRGKPAAMQGRVFKNYNPEYNVVPSFDVPSHWPTWVGIDPHTHKPHMVVFLSVSPSGDFYISNEIYHRCDINELAEHILEIESQYNIVQRLIDTSSQEEDWSKKSAREMLAAPPYRIRTKLAQKKNLKKSGIKLINQYLKNAHKEDGPHPRLYIMEHCHRTKKELTYQKYKINKRDKQMIFDEPEKKWDEATDSIRYILVENPTYRGVSRIYDPGPLYGRGGM